jgi:signal transduction histidine kinase
MSLHQRVVSSCRDLYGRHPEPDETVTLPVDRNWARRLIDGGEMGARICSINWSNTPLGPLGDWPQSLREALTLCVRSRYQLAISWGPELILLYNDAERDGKAYPSKDSGVSVFFHDITALKRSEETLRKSHDELEARVEERTRELSRANARLGRQVGISKRMEKERTELQGRLVRVQEEEHRRIARELHDDLTQQLAVLAIDAGTLAQHPSCPQDIVQKVSAMREKLVALSESIHSLSRQLHPSILDDLGLVDALRLECLALGQRDKIKVKYDARDIPTDLPRDVSLCIYRVAQEALRNVTHHAQCAKASVMLAANERQLVLRVQDKGIGFDVNTQGKRGLGLESMRERVRHIRARFRVQSRPGEGTCITMRVPLHRSRT